MSIFNSVAALIASGGEMEQSTITGLSAGDTIAFNETHSTAPDVFLLTCDYLNLTANDDMAVFVYINGTNNFDNNWAWLGWLDGEMAVYKRYGGVYTDALYNGSVSDYMTASGITIPYISGYVPNYDVTYNWYALWANGTGSGSGGGGGSVNLQEKTHIGASTSSQTITADTGYDGLSSVQIDPVSQTNLTAANIKSGTTVSISNGTSNLWSVTGTYSGGSSKNVQTKQTTSRVSSSSLTSVNSLTCSTAGTYDVYWTCSRSSTSGTWSSQLYLGGTAYGSEQTTWSNHVQTVKLTGVTISANQTVAVYVKTRGSNYYGYCPQLTIVQTS